MFFEILRSENYKKMPWKNQKGVTEEIFRYPRVDPTGEFIWRLSRAPVLESGAFSKFPGYDRLLTLIEGSSLSLNVSGHAQQVIQNQVTHFSGDEDTEAFLQHGAVRDLGLIYQRSLVEARMSNHLSISHLFKDPKDYDFILYYCVSGQPKLGKAETSPLILERGDTVIWSRFDNVPASGIEVIDPSSAARFIEIQVKLRNI